MISAIDGNQPGDPKRAAKAVIDLVRSDNPPLQLLLGRIVLDSYREKLETIRKSLDEWEEVTLATDFPTESA